MARDLYYLVRNAPMDDPKALRELFQAVLERLDELEKKIK